MAKGEYEPLCLWPYIMKKSHEAPEQTNLPTTCACLGPSRPWDTAFPLLEDFRNLAIAYSCSVSMRHKSFLKCSPVLQPKNKDLEDLRYTLIKCSSQGSQCPCLAVCLGVWAPHFDGSHVGDQLEFLVQTWLLWAGGEWANTWKNLLYLPNKIWNSKGRTDMTCSFCYP